MCTWKGTKNLIRVSKIYCNAKIGRLGKVMWMAKRQRQNYNSLQRIYNLMNGLEQVPKGLQECLLEFYIKLQQHFSTMILYWCLNIAIMWKSLVNFPKLKMLRVLVYLLKYKFHFNKNCVFVALYGIQKLKTKTCFSQTFEVKTCFQAKNCS